MQPEKIKKTNSLIKYNYIFRIFGMTVGAIIVLSITDGTNPLVIFLITLGICWPHIAYFLSAKLFYDVYMKSEKVNFCIDSFIYGMTAFITSFNILIIVAMWIANILNCISIAGIRLYLKSLIFYILGIFILFPFKEFTIKPESSLATIILFLSFITLYMIITATNLFKSIDSNRNKRKQIQKINTKLESELEFAKTIQINLMPDSNPSKNIACLYRPMMQVGGDFYDFIKFRDPGKIGIFISDVSGHGVPAALITSMIKSILLQAGDKKDNPSELLMYMNNILQKQISNNFVTAFYGIYNYSERSIIYSNAGHNNPYLIGSEISQLPGTNNKALLLFKNKLKSQNSEYENHKEILPPGSKLLLYTDGLTEARPMNREIFFENSKLIDVLLQNKEKECQPFVDSLYKELVSFRQSETFDDDICMICLDVQ